MTGRVILIDDEKHLRVSCTQSLELAGYQVDSFATASDALGMVNARWPGVIVTDVRMAGMDGLALMAAVLERDPDLPVILMTGHGDIAMAVKAMRDGAYDFIEKPFAPDVLLDAVHRALDKRVLVLENRDLRDALDSGSPLERLIVGVSETSRQLREKTANFAVADADVLIHGETGTGKELVARALHELGARSTGTFVPVNCGALPASIIESELFGHDKGAFTGADKTRIGKFEYADGGTIFLDEIESMPMELQARLLRVLENRIIVRLGSNDEIPIDVRVIAATKSDLRAKADQNQFREDLFYRLNVLTIAIEPLRRRLDDIPILAAHFLAQARARFKCSAEDIDATTMALLQTHDWPGNARELKNSVIRYALGQGFDPWLAGDDPPVSSRAGLANQIAAVEAQIVRTCLEHHGGILKPTYEELGISRKTLYEKLKKYGIGEPEISDE